MSVLELFGTDGLAGSDHGEENELFFLVLGPNRHYTLDGCLVLFFLDQLHDLQFSQDATDCCFFRGLNVKLLDDTCNFLVLFLFEK